MARLLFGLSTALTPVLAGAQDLPTGASVVHGNVGIARSGGGAMTITQGSSNAIVNWDGFSIGAGNRVDIHQPDAASALLNRVTGSATSRIHGQLNANGQVFLVNPNGIFIGPDGTVNAGGFVASSLGVRDSDFVLNRPEFAGGGASATVSNAGTINIAPGGYAALLGGKVSNSGLIRAPMGKVGLGAGERAVLDFGGDGFLQVAVPSDGDGEGALIDNAGAISADGGHVIMSAATARDAVRHAVNLSGVVEARTVSGRNGMITLGGGLGGNVAVSGRLDASAGSATGGKIKITGEGIALTGARIDASGATGGGTINIGGLEGGAPGLQTAKTLSVDGATTIKADAVTRGDGGRIILWSDLATGFAGKISARGGDLGGDGGFAEVSGKIDLTYSGRSDMRAPHGKWGKTVLDPVNMSVVSVITGPGQILNTTVEANLGSGDFDILTSGIGTEPGDIVIDASVSWATASTFGLVADRDITINAPISGPAGNLYLYALRDITTGAGGAIELDEFWLEHGDWKQNSATLPAFDVTGFSGDIGATFLRVLGGDGSMGNPYRITDVYGLQGIASGTYGADHWQLANDIDASGTAGWVDYFSPLFPSDVHFIPIGSLSGSIDGGRHTITGLHVTQTDPIGLGEDDLTDKIEDGSVTLADTISGGRAAMIDTITASGKVSELWLDNAVIVGNSGAVLAQTNEGTVEGVFVAGEVHGFYDVVGGVAAHNTGTIRDSAAAVVLTDDSDPSGNMLTFESFVAGGIAGVNWDTGRIERINSTGTVTASLTEDFAGGGVAGVNLGMIENVTSTTPVTAHNLLETYIGGIAGVNFGTIATSWSIGAVASTAGMPLFEGGLVGLNALGSSTGTETGLFFDKDTSGQTGTAGGGVGLTTAEMLDTAGFKALAEPAGWDFGGVWAPPNGTRYASKFTTSPVIYALPDEVSFTYNGTDDGFTPTGMFVGGPNVYVFSQIDDDLDPADLNVNVLAASSQVGDHAYEYQDGTLLSDMGDTYFVHDEPGLVHITPAPLTIIPDAQSKDYGTTFTFVGDEFTTAGLVSGDGSSVSSVTLTSAGTVDTATVDGGPYTINVTPASEVGVGLSNYAVSYDTAALTVDPIPLDIFVSDQSKTYGETFTFAGTEFTTSPLLFSDSVDSLVLASLGAAATAEVSGSPYAITGTAPLGTGVGNYAITVTPGEMTVTPAPLTITADDQSKGFGTTFTFLGTEFTSSGLVNGDTVSAATLTSTATDAGAPKGTAPILISNPLGDRLDNYTITLENGTFTVDAAVLTITANDQSKIYGSTLTFDGTEFTASGLFSGDSVDSVTLSSAGAVDTATVAGGPYTIEISNPMGTGLDNYTVTLEPGSLSVDPATLTITPDGQSKTYGETFTFAGTEFTSTGLLPGDTLTSVSLTSDGAGAGAGVDDSPYGILGSTPVGTGLGNYEIAFGTGEFTVNPASASVTVADQSKTYGDTFTFAGTEFTVTGLASGDTLDSLTLASAGAAATATVAAAPYAITATDPVGSGVENYTFAFTPGSFDVAARPLTITASDQSKIYGDAFTFLGTEFSQIGLTNGDTVDSATLSSPGAAMTAGVASYLISITGPTGSGLENYVITLVDGSFFVSPATLSVTAVDLTKTYGEEVVFDGTEITVTGLRNSDSVTSAELSSAGAPASAPANAPSGTPIEIGDVFGTGLGNYTISKSSGTLTVERADLTIAANDQTKIVGQELVFDGTEFTTTGLENTDSVASVLLSSDGASAEAAKEYSPYPIFISSPMGSGLGNYNITLVEGSMTVSDEVPAPVTTPPPPFQPSVPNPQDTIRIADEDGTGSIQATGGGDGGLQQATRALEVVDEATTELEIAARSCGSDQDFNNVMSCLSSSLDTYANALDQIENDLPAGLENVSAIITSARNGIDAATARAQRRLASAATDAERAAIQADALAEARASIDTARNEVRKAITLIRADDPEIAAVQRQTVNRIVQAFDAVDSVLVRAVEL